MRERNPFGSAPWPRVRGNAFNTSVSAATSSLKGETLWALPIAAGGLDGIVVAEDGCIFTNTLDAMYAIEPDGEIRWKHRAARGIGAPVVLADGSVICWEDGRIVCREQSSGKLRWASDEEGWTRYAPSVTRDGIIIHNRSLPDGYEDISAFWPGKGIVWSYRLSGTRYTSALAMDGLTVVIDGSYLAGLDSAGKLLWLANYRGFVPADAANTIERQAEHEYITTPPMALGSRFAAGCRWYDGAKLFIFDPEQMTAAAWPNRADIRVPYESPIAISAEPTIRLAGKLIGDSVLSFTASGDLVFNVRLPAPMLNVLFDAAGNTIVSTSFDRDYWEKYREAYALHNDCGLSGFDGTGRQIFRWAAPGPLEYSLAAGRAGELYCVSEGCLWAVG